MKIDGSKVSHAVFYDGRKVFHILCCDGGCLFYESNESMSLS